MKRSVQWRSLKRVDMAQWIVSCGPRVLGNLLSCVVLLACGDRLIQLASDSRDGAVMDGALLDAATDARVVVDTGVPAQCGDAACACDNGVDDDSDGLIDGFDPECTGASDDDERTFATGSIGNANPPCQDCFFDDNASGDDDGCQVHVECIYGREPPMVGEAACATCDVSRDCADTCRPRTPNGCDCFGCCTINIKGQPKVNIRLQDTCSLALLDDEAACPRCEPNDGCRNPCGRCELCPGRTEADLPMDCGNDGRPMDPGHKCDDREAVCGPDLPCAATFYCQQGCCLPQLL